MGKTVISVENLSKQYRLGQVGTGTVADDLNRWWAQVRGKEDPTLKVGEANDRTIKGESDYVWSLRDINFDVKEGETVGIIGKNGAGKSTLLKILSKVTGPTTGSVKVRGRVASLLEVGTGFHPELSGRENIFLNGAILGMKRHEIKAKFDEIVAFSGVERYIDTPVKRYSSGMYVRLAFAVAAHLEPEILIVDEVLAVGDTEFQKKCLGKMKDVSGEGRTILFVSHNMAAVKSLCMKGIVLEKGCHVFSGSQHDAIKYYQKENNTNTSFRHSGTMDNAPGNSNIRILRFNVNPASGDLIEISSGIVFEIEFYNFIENINLDVTFELRTSESIVVFHHGKIISSNRDSKKGVYCITGILNKNLLNAGEYLFTVIFGQNQRGPLYYIEDFIKFEVMNETVGSNSSIRPGFIVPNIEYDVEYYQK